MSTTTLKKELHKTIDEINDSSILAAVFTLLNKNVPPSNGLTASQKKELEKRLKNHNEGKLKYFTLNEVKSTVLQALAK